jgi:very-short-patch-repair endonuclease
MKKQMFYSAGPTIFQRAKELRNLLTDAERILWMQLRTKPKGYKFRRQHPAGNYILDFYCHALKIAIEVDGSIHNDKKVQEADYKRQKNLEADDIYVVRFSNKEVMTSIEYVNEQINAAIDNRILYWTTRSGKLFKNES